MAVQSDTTSAPFVTAPSSEISNVYREGICRWHTGVLRHRVFA